MLLDMILLRGIKMFYLKNKKRLTSLLRNIIISL